jgi:hypothetical protein
MLQISSTQATGCKWQRAVTLSATSVASLQGFSCANNVRASIYTQKIGYDHLGTLTIIFFPFF